MKTQVYQINSLFATKQNIPSLFVAKELKRTSRATYLYGHGTLETIKTGMCCICGRTLTHPVSVQLGIGPECGGHYWNWDAIGGYSVENLERLKKEMEIKIVDFKVDCWVPNTCIKNTFPSNEKITVPINHPQLTPPDQINNKKASFIGNKIKIEFSYDITLVNKIKELPERKFNVDGKYWTIPLSLSGIHYLLSLGFTLDDYLKEYFETRTTPLKSIDNIPGLKYTLFPFQKQGVSFIEAKNGRSLIADEMGLGKTIQALAWLQLHPEHRPAIVVTPASLKYNWKKEMENGMTDPKIEILSGKKAYKTSGKILIINYDILGDWVEPLKELKAKALIMDEVHYIKSNKTNRTIAAKELAKGIPHLIALSGTPIMNRPIEMYNAINLIDPTLFPNAWVYAKKYCGAYNNGFGWDFNGATNTDELHQKLINTCMIRRKKVDVLKDLPEKITSFVPIPIDNEMEYRNAEHNFINYIRETKGQIAAIKASNAEMLTQVNTLKQLCVKGKLKGCVEWIENFLESGQKLVIFVTHIDTVNQLMTSFPKNAVRYDGSVSLLDRDKAVTAFQENPNINLFIGMLDSQGKPSGVGLTLTAAYATATIEYQWSPGVHDQADDRIHRIGQKNACINYKLLALNTIEEKIAHMLDEKRRVLDSILDGKITEENNLLTELICKYTNQ